MGKFLWSAGFWFLLYVLLVGASVISAVRAEPSPLPGCQPLRPATNELWGSVVVNADDLLDALVVVDEASYLDLGPVVSLTDQRGCYAVTYRIGGAE